MKPGLTGTRWRRVAAAIAGAAFFVACQPPAAPATPAGTLAPAGTLEQAQVVHVTDGDTITVEIGATRYTVRYIGIDAPEKDGPFTDPEPFGTEATQANDRLVGGQTVQLERDVSDVDRFGRLLRYVWVQEGAGWVLANRELVRQGMADSHAYEPDTRWQQVLDDAEGQARGERLGIWSNP